MTSFPEYIEIMKNMFDTFDVDGKFAAIDQVDEFLNWMSYRWQNEHEQPGYPILLQNAEEMILDRFGEEWETEHIQPIEQQNVIYYDEITEEHDMPSTSYASTKTSNPPLSCFTCGIEAKNNKALYRHGIRFSHQTRPLTKNGFVVGRKPKIKSEVPTKKDEPLIDNCEDSLPLKILEGEESEEEEQIEEDKREDEKTADSKSYNCYTCGIFCKNRKALYRHGLRFKHKTRENRSAKSKGGQFKCELCVDYSTTRIQYLRRHHKRQHNLIEATQHIDNPPELVNGSQ